MPKPVSCAKLGKLLSEEANQSGSDPATLHRVLHQSTNLEREALDDQMRPFFSSISFFNLEKSKSQKEMTNPHVH